MGMSVDKNAKRIAVIGGGASGMAAAIVASSPAPVSSSVPASSQSAGHASTAFVTLFEHRSELGKKILATGNGRCNLGHASIDIEAFHSSKKEGEELIGKILEQFGPSDTMSFFKGLGLWVKDMDGYLYPESEQALSVREVLAAELNRRGVEVVLNSDISVIKHNPDGTFTVVNNGKDYIFDKVILSCGSYAGIASKDRIQSDRDGYSLAYGLGHKVIKVKPALCGIECGDGAMHSYLAGVRVKGSVTVTAFEGNSLSEDSNKKYSSRGEIQFTDYGISGIPVFDISRYIGGDEKVEIKIQFLDNFGWEKRVSDYFGRCVADLFRGTVNSKLADYYIKELLKIKTEDVIDSNIKEKLLSVGFGTLNIPGPYKTRKFENAQVCRGGIPLDEVNENLESKVCPGLYVTGEMLDADAICGGYNLHWAWATGCIAGRAVRENLTAQES